MLTGRENDGYELPIVGDDAAELTVDAGMLIGTAIGSRELRPPMGDPREGWTSRR